MFPLNTVIPAVGINDKWVSGVDIACVVTELFWLVSEKPMFSCNCSCSKSELGSKCMS